MTTRRTMRGDRCQRCIHYQAGSCQGLVDDGICDDYERGPGRSAAVASLALCLCLAGLAVLLAIRCWGGR